MVFGIEVYVNAHGALGYRNIYGLGNGTVGVFDEDTNPYYSSFAVDSQVGQAIAEFYQKRRDSNLGRWRDPVNSDFVVYWNTKDDVAEIRSIFNEATGESHAYPLERWEAELLDAETIEGRFYDAHPLPKVEPKPWHEATHGEVWIVDGTARAVTNPLPGSGSPIRFVDVDSIRPAIDVMSPNIQEAYRVWSKPEEF